MIENNDIDIRYTKTIEVIQSCLNEEHLTAATKMVDNFAMFINDGNRHVTSTYLIQLKHLLKTKTDEIIR
jgi:hypothetical protein